jgi:hypothetical protein
LSLTAAKLVVLFATVLLVIYENDCLIAGSDEKIGEVIKPLKRFYFLCQR